jgi:uncharacterized membrane protein
MENSQLSNSQLSWTSYLCLILGGWLIATSLTFDVESTAVVWNDLVVGLLVLFLSPKAMRPHRTAAAWLIALLGVWLQLTPLLFWAPTTLGYLNDTLVGILLILFSVVIPLPFQEQPGPEKPKGWLSNPSSWEQRIPIFCFALIAWFSSRYMTSYQLGYLSAISDPLFGSGTLQVITSPIAEAFPVSDAGLGAFNYTLEAILAVMGGTRRWYTLPWLVVFFSILVVPAGVISIVLIILQPVAVGAWCFWCLLAAVAMLLMIIFTFNEAVAVSQFLAQVREEGKPFWRTFWQGGAAVETPQPIGPPVQPLRQLIRSAIAGITLPWNLLLSGLIGIWLVASTESVFGITGAVADQNYIFGALIITIAGTACAEAARAIRFINLPFGLWMALQPWILSGATLAGAINGLICGLVLVAATFRRGPVREQFGSWNRYII